MRPMARVVRFGTARKLLLNVSKSVKMRPWRSLESGRVMRTPPATEFQSVLLASGSPLNVENLALLRSSSKKPARTNALTLDDGL